MSKKEENLVKKIKGILDKAGCPRFLHHFGPKRYEFKMHALALLLNYAKAEKEFQLFCGILY